MCVCLFTNQAANREYFRLSHVVSSALMWIISIADNCSLHYLNNLEHKTMQFVVKPQPKSVYLEEKEEKKYLLIAQLLAETVS